jgi:hypothetical protein
MGIGKPKTTVTQVVPRRIKGYLPLGRSPNMWKRKGKYGVFVQRTIDAFSGKEASMER